MFIVRIILNTQNALYGKIQNFLSSQNVVDMATTRISKSRNINFRNTKRHNVMETCEVETYVL